MPSMWLSDNQKIGVAFCTGGAFFFIGGIMLFFDRAMLAMGNILLLIGLVVLLGPQKTAAFFLRKNKLKGTATFSLGIFLILMRWAFIGFAFELYGIFVLFGDFLGTMLGFLGNIPVVGPYIRMLTNRLGLGGSSEGMV